MKNIAKSIVVALALALSLSFAAGTTADAAKKVKVSSVKAVNPFTGAKSGKFTITLTKGKKVTLKNEVTVTPNKSANKKVTYKTSNKKVATVTSKGKVKAVKKGKAKITIVSKKNKSKKATVTVKVVTGKVTSVALDKKEVTIVAGKSETVKATVKKKGSANTTLAWKSSNEKVATVKAGKITAVAPGTATITAKATDGTGKSATVKVTVVKQTTTLSLVDKQKVTAKITFADDATPAKIAEDVDKAVTILGAKDKEITLTIDKNEYKVKGSDAKAKIASKAKRASVEVVAEIDASYSLSSAVFTPATVKSIAIGDATFTNIKADSFTLNGKDYTYTASGKNVVVDGHVAADFAKITALKAEEN